MIGKRGGKHAVTDRFSVHGQHPELAKIAAVNFPSLMITVDWFAVQRCGLSELPGPPGRDPILFSTTGSCPSLDFDWIACADLGSTSLVPTITEWRTVRVVQAE